MKNNKVIVTLLALLMTINTGCANNKEEETIEKDETYYIDYKLEDPLFIDKEDVRVVELYDSVDDITDYLVCNYSKTMNEAKINGYTSAFDQMMDQNKMKIINSFSEEDTYTSVNNNDKKLIVKYDYIHFIYGNYIYEADKTINLYYKDDKVYTIIKSYAKSDNPSFESIEEKKCFILDKDNTIDLKDNDLFITISFMDCLYGLEEDNVGFITITELKDIENELSKEEKTLFYTKG